MSGHIDHVMHQSGTVGMIQTIPTLSMYVGTIERLEHEVRALKSRVDKHDGGTFFTMHVHFFFQEVCTYVCAFDVGFGLHAGD